MPTDLNTWASAINQLLECVFFGIIVVITIRTYAHAKKDHPPTNQD